MLGEFVPTAWHESFHTLCLSFAQDTGPGDFNPDFPDGGVWH